jgi:hypothetical protein
MVSEEVEFNAETQGSREDKAEGVRAALGWTRQSLIPLVVTPLYRDMAKSLSAANYCNGDSDSISTCIDSGGLSCHYWLDNAAKPCPGIGIIGQLPQVIGYPRVRVAGDAEFILS